VHEGTVEIEQAPADESVAALRENAERLRLIHAAAGIGGFDYDLQQDEAICSPEYYALLGLPDGFPISRQTWLALMPTEDRAGALEALNAAIAERRPFAHEYRILRADTGEVRWLSCRATLVFDSQDRPWRYVGANIDVTDSKRAEAASHEREARFRSLFQQKAPGFIVILRGPDHVYEFHNDAYGSLVGKTDLIGRTVREAVPEVGQQGRFDLLDQVYRTGEPFVGLERPLEVPVGPGGKWETRYLDFIYQPIKDADGKVTGIFIEGSDATQRVQAREALHASEVQYRSLFDSIDQGFCTIEVLFDEQDRPVDYLFLATNKAFLHQTGLSDAVGRRMRQMVPDHEPLWFEIYGRIARTRQAERFEHQAASLDRWYEVYAFPLGAPGSNRLGILFGDIAPRKRTEQALRDSEERQAFLLRLSDALAALADPLAVQAAAARLLGEHLGVDRVTYSELKGGEEMVHREYVHGVASGSGRAPLADLDPSLLEAYRRGEPFVMDDVVQDARLAVGERAALANAGEAAFAGAGLVQGGRLVAAISLHSQAPRRWKAAEIELLRPLADRIWTAVERARAEQLVADDLRDTGLLRELGARSVIAGDAQAFYESVLSVAIEIMQAQAGTVQILDVATRELVILATRGFSPEVTEHFLRVNAESTTSCGLALLKNERSFLDFDVPAAEDPDGTLRLHFDDGYRSAQSTPLIARSGRPIGMVSTHWRERHRPGERELRFLDLLTRQVADMIEQRQSEQALRESEERLRQFGEASADVLWIRDAKTLQWEYLSASYEEVYGMSREHAMQAPDNLTEWARMIVPEDREYVLSCIERVRAGESLSFEFRIRRPSDGEIRWIRKTDFPVLNNEGRVQRIAGIGSDITDRRRTEEALRRSEERHSLLLELSDTLRPLTDPLEIQAEAARLFGAHLGATRAFYSDFEDGEFVVHRDYVDGVPSVAGRHAAAAFGEQLLAAFLHGERISVASVAKDPRFTAAERDRLADAGIAAFLAFMLMKSGRLVGAFTVQQATPRAWTAAEIEIGQEIAERLWTAIERARAELALQQREAELARVQRIGGVGGVDVDVAGGLTGRRSLEYLRLHGLPLDVRFESHEAWLQRIHPADRAQADAALRMALAGSDLTYESEYRIIRPSDGEERWIFAKADIERDPTGRPVRLIGAHIDVTRRKETEAALRKSDERLQLALDAASMGTFIWHVQEDHGEPDERMLALFGQSPDGTLTLKEALATLLHPDDRERYGGAVARATDSAGNGEIREDIRVQLPDGRLRWIAITGQVHFEGDPPIPIRMAGAAIDITARKQIEESLRAADLQKSEFLAMLGHELRNPLAAIKGGMRLMQSEKARPESKAAAMPIVADQVLHMERLIDDVLDLARIEQGKLQIRLERIVLQETVERAVEMVKELARAKGSAVAYRMPSEPIRLEADAVRLTQVLVNLLTNALKFSPDGSTVDVDLERDPCQAVLRVRDQGFGIAPDLLPRIFESFVQSKRSLQIPEGGLGLGLSVARQLVELHGGTIEALSQGEGHGSEFVIRLPVEPAP
jgi:PAS domain S-box-containing protein